MSKKWLYSAALSALLMAGEALGITVQEFFNLEPSTLRPSYDRYLKSDRGFYRGKYLNDVTVNYPDGSVKKSYLFKTTYCGTAWKRWNAKKWYTSIQSDDEWRSDEKIQLTDKRENKYKDKTLTNKQEHTRFMNHLVTNEVTNIQETYTVKGLKKDVHPMGSYVVDDWFPDRLDKSWITSELYGTEQTAITNIISDNEAYITRTVRQTGYIDTYKGYVVEEPASLLRVYNTHITTDANHVYVDQDIMETSTNSSGLDYQNNYQTQYTATFNKKGRWKGATETITITQNAQASDWFMNYIKSQSSQNTR